MPAAADNNAWGVVPYFLRTSIVVGTKTGFGLHVLHGKLAKSVTLNKGGLGRLNWNAGGSYPVNPVPVSEANHDVVLVSFEAIATVDHYDAFCDDLTIAIHYADGPDTEYTLPVYVSHRAP